MEPRIARGRARVVFGDWQHVKCESCGDVNREGSQFCARCGSVLVPFCKVCELEQRSDALFCDRCGERLPEPKNVQNLFQRLAPRDGSDRPDGSGSSGLAS